MTQFRAPMRPVDPMVIPPAVAPMWPGRAAATRKGFQTRGVPRTIFFDLRRWSEPIAVG